jgi:hypothetical protein
MGLRGIDSHVADATAGQNKVHRSLNIAVIRVETCQIDADRHPANSEIVLRADLIAIDFFRLVRSSRGYGLGANAETARSIAMAYGSI